MATEQVIVEYLADIQGFRAQLKSVEESMKKVETTTKQTAQTTTKEFQKTSDSIKQGATQIASALGIAFGVHKIIEFGKESIKAFAESEEQANKLKFAVQKIGGEGTIALKKLTEQAESLKKSTIFSGGQIQNAQTMLTQFGLTSDQVEALIPKITDLASATGMDLASATDKAIQGINGQTRGLKEVGIQFADTGSKTENLAVLTDKLSKFQGASADALETTVGKAKRLENAFGDIQEKIGEYLVNEGVAILDNFETVFGDKNAVAVRQASEKVGKAMDEVNLKTLENAKKSEKARFDAIKQTEKNIVDLSKQGLKQKDAVSRQVTANAIKNQQVLLSELNALNQKQVIEDDKTLGGAKIEAQEDLSKKLRDLETANIRLSYDRRRQEILNNFSDEETKYAGHLDILTQLDTQRENQLSDLYNEREKEYGKIRKDAVNKNVEIFKEGSGKMKAEDTTLSGVVIQNQDDIIKKAEEAARVRKRIEEQVFEAINASISAFGQISANITQNEINEIDKRTEKQIQSLDYQLEHKLISQETYDSKIEALEKEKAEKQRKLKKKQFETDKQVALVEAIIATAQAIIKAFADTGYPGAILAGVVGAAQIAVIASEPTPQFEKGGKVKGKRHSAGGTLIEAEKDEWIINRNDAMKNDKLLDAINKGNADKFIFDHYIAPSLKAQQKKNSENKEKSFAHSLAQSMSLNFKDGNLLDSMKQSRKNDKEIALFLARELKPTRYDARRF